ncbi:hypothetical protein BRM3_08830 [Brachybacterium huguangmaarense]|uniref:Preprotein translocase subunit SecB n=1 Tax=Brachybacterium huguangmaarense TaxID=1652028 RepID=A0ABY6FZA7_9MICO|nr:hypothetical protein [Brachybacterium huguangmaarense]UYG15748.1 hypothetical protein BRM3_08830 [Brachybacterium huguangmaarense]
MSDPAKTIHFESAVQMLDAGANLESVNFYELSAVINEDWSSESELPTDAEPEFYLKHIVSDREFSARLRTRMDMGIGVVIVDASATYTFTENIAVSKGAAEEFVNRVAVMALLPYIRQAVADLTQRVFGDPFVIPILHAGELVFEITES